MEEYYMGPMMDFLRQLAANNYREWFMEHKTRFEELRSHWLHDVDRLAALLAEDNEALRGLTARDCVYRIYRDTRFTHDKTPYKTFLSAAFAPGGRRSPYAGVYLQVSPFEDGDGGLYGGLWCPEAPVLKKLRHAIVDNIEEWEEVTSDAALNRDFELMTTGMLKTSPKGWDKNHPQARWLRMKDYGWWHAMGPEEFLRPGWVERVAALARPLKGPIDFLNYSMDE